MLKSRAVAVGGLTCMLTPGVSVLQRKHWRISKFQTSLLSPCLRTQLSHIICLHGKQYRGLPLKHTKHVFSKRIVSQSRLNSDNIRKCHMALDTLSSLANASACFTNSTSSSLMKLDGRIKCVDPSWARTPVRQT